MTNEELIQNMIGSGRLKSDRIIEAFRAIDRKDFVPSERSEEAYYDYPLPTGYNSTISQPSTVAFMLELLNTKKGEKVLEIGSGSGWVVAMLAHITESSGVVYGAEIVPELVESSKKNINKYNLNNTYIIMADNVLGAPEGAPFDRIIVSAAAKYMPEELIYSQLKVGGRMIIPVEASIWKIDKIADNEYIEEEFFGFSFVPLK